MTTISLSRIFSLALLLVCTSLFVSGSQSVFAQQQQNQPIHAKALAKVRAAEKSRIETIARISLPTIAIFDSQGKGGGSGVIISADGYALTNFHVTAPCGPGMLCGLNTGETRDAVLVGLDPTGDIALIKLLGRNDFPVATLGDSDKVKAGDWAYVAGNPFLLADDFKPTITYGIISGVHRYQFPADTLLEYADCLQTDASINPGNSGGPLFNSAGELIGINGRGSFEKRGRVNVGVGYAISINQIKKFLGYLHSGRIVDHATLGALVSTDYQGRVIIDEILDDSDAFRRGLRFGDEIVQFGGRRIETVNGFKNILGTFPRGWRIPITYRRAGKTFEILVRLQGVHGHDELIGLVQKQSGKPPQRPPSKKPKNKKGKPKKAVLPRRADKLKLLPLGVQKSYLPKKGYANLFFNNQELQRVWKHYQQWATFSQQEKTWLIRAQDQTKQTIGIAFTPAEGTLLLPIGEMSADFRPPLQNVTIPARSGGLLTALHMWQRLLLLGPKKYGQVRYLGTLPIYQYDPHTKKLSAQVRLQADCLVGIYSGIETRFYFDPKNGQLVAIEMFANDETDPCEIYFEDYLEKNKRTLPYRWIVLHNDQTFADWKITEYHWPQLEPTPKKLAPVPQNPVPQNPVP